MIQRTATQILVSTILGPVAYAAMCSNSCPRREATCSAGNSCLKLYFNIAAMITKVVMVFTVVVCLVLNAEPYGLTYLYNSRTGQ